MKRLSLFIRISVCVVAILGTTVTLSHAAKKFLTLASGSPGGVYYTLGGGMATVIEKMVPDLRCAAESTGASVENARLVGSGSSDLGMLMGSVAYNAREGLAPFEQKFPIVALFQMYPAPEHIVTTKQSGIKSIGDLKGKKVSVDVPGSGAQAMAKAILIEYGFDLEKDLTLANLSQSESVAALKDGIVDACFFNFAYPASVIMDIAATRDLVLVPMEKEMLDKIIKKFPYYLPVTIPAGTYPKMDTDVACLGDSNLMVVNENMADDVAYEIVKAIFNNIDKGDHALTNVHPIAKQMNPREAVKSPLPLHPGAVKFFKEVGALN